MKPLLKPSADLSNSFSSISQEHLQLTIVIYNTYNYCSALMCWLLLQKKEKKKKLDSPFLSMITSTQFPCWMSLTLLYLYFVNIIQVITHYPVIRIYEKFHLCFPVPLLCRWCTILYFYSYPRSWPPGPNCQTDEDYHTHLSIITRN